jgi:hypothetical protein
MKLIKIFQQYILYKLQRLKKKKRKLREFLSPPLRSLKLPLKARKIRRVAMIV